VRSFWLCKKANRKRALRYKVLRGEGRGDGPKVEFEVFEPRNENELPAGTVTRAKATCLCCGSVLPPERVRAQLAAQRGGADVIFDEKGNRIGGAQLLAVVTLKPDEQGRYYRLPTQQDYEVLRKAHNQLKETLAEWTRTGSEGLCPIPNEAVDIWHHDVNRLPMYGMSSWGEIHTNRQKLLLLTIRHACMPRTTLNEVLALAADKLADKSTSLCRWKASAEYMAGNTFSRQALGLVWDFCEAQPFSGVSGGWQEEVEWIAKVIDTVSQIPRGGEVQQADACISTLPDESVNVWFTDPPYYDAIDYAYCSDFFFCWLKRHLADHSLLHDPYDLNNVLTPKKNEIVVDSTTTKGHGVRTPHFYEEAMGKAFAEGRRILREGGIGSIVFAHKTTEGWEALLSGMIKGGWVITGSWPIATEAGSRLRAMDSAALATSVHLVCRPRPEDALVGDWGEVLRELPKRVGDWMERLQSEGIRGADLVFACIGPALEIYSRYSKVVDAEEREIPLGGDPEATEPHRKGFLSYVWEVVGRTALEHVLGTAEAKARNSTAGALEEDARLTALFLWTLQSTNGNGKNGSIGVSPVEDEEEEDTGKDAGATKKKQGYSLIFDVVRRFAQPLGIHLPEWEGRIIETEKGVVRLLSVKDRAKQLFGEENISVAGIRIEEQARRDPQMKFDFAITSVRGAPPKIKGHHKRKGKGLPAETAAKAVTTTLDRVHAAMLLQASGQTNALRALLKAEQERGPDFLRLANALSALYPKQSEEKRLLDAMLLAMPR